MDVTKPGTLTAAGLADAAATIDATLVFASPAALRNVVATAGELTAEQSSALARIRLVLSAGAPVSVALLRRLREVLPHAELHTPYGMTEALPLTDISLPELEEAGSGNGVCVGRPLPGVQIQISPLDSLGRAAGPPGGQRRGSPARSVCPRPTSRSVTTGSGRPRGQVLAIRAGIVRAMSGTSTAAGGCGLRAVWCTSSRPPTDRSPRSAWSNGSRPRVRSPAPRWSVSALGALSRWWRWLSQTLPPRLGWRRRSLPAAVRAAAGVRVAAVLVIDSVAGGHPARRQDRPAATRPLGRAGASRCSGRSAVGAEDSVRVLVTGATGMLGRGVAPSARRQG